VPEVIILELGSATVPLVAASFSLGLVRGRLVGELAQLCFAQMAVVIRIPVAFA